MVRYELKKIKENPFSEITAEYTCIWHCVINRNVNKWSDQTAFVLTFC